MLFVLLFSIKANQRVLKVVLLYCIYSFLNDSILLYLSYSKDDSDLGLILLSTFTVVEFSLFSLILRMILKKEFYRKVIFYLIPAFILFAGILFYLSLTLKNSIDSISITVEYILVIAFALFYFFEEISYPNTAFIYFSYKFWVVVGILIYSTGTFFFFMYSSSLDGEEWNNWSIINYVFTIIKNALFSIAVIIARKESKKIDEYRIQFNEQLEVFNPK
jgi:hypothetical protein